MPSKKVLFIGFGKLARLTYPMFANTGYTVTAVARTPLSKSDSQGFENLTFICGSVLDSQVQNAIAQQQFDVVIITLTPDGREAEDYANGYLKPAHALADLWQRNAPPKQVLFVSSTRVYAQNRGQWVDERSETNPDSAQGEILLNAENALRARHLTTTAVRFSGIYGGTRQYLLRQVLAGNGGGAQYTNRIHEEDCARVLHFLAEKSQTETLPEILLATDDEPLPSQQVRQWLAKALLANSRVADDARERIEKLAMQTLPDAEVSAKRCRNDLLKALGFDFTYPSFKVGYADLAQRDLSNL